MTSISDAAGNPLRGIRLKATGVEAVGKIHPHQRGTYFRIRPEDHRRLRNPELGTLDLVYLDSQFCECRPVAKTEGLLRLIPVGMYGPPEKCYYTEVTDIPGLLYSRFGEGACAFFP